MMKTKEINFRLEELPVISLENRHLLPNVCAVYIIHNTSEIIYVGATLRLNSRIRSHTHYKTFLSFDELQISWIESNKYEYDDLEIKIIKQFKPSLNKRIPSKKEPDEIMRRINRYRIKKGLSKESLCAWSRIEEELLRDLENGRRKSETLPLKVIMRICDVLEVDISVLTGYRRRWRSWT